MIDYVPFGVTKLKKNQQVKKWYRIEKVSILSIFAQIYSVSYRFKIFWYRPPLHCNHLIEQSAAE